MGFFTVFKIRRMLGKVRKIEQITAPLITIFALETKSVVASGVPSWNLDNKILLLFLGYVAGVIDAAEYVIYGKEGKPRRGVLLIDCLFIKWIITIFSDLPGASEFIDIEEKSLHARIDGFPGGGAISGLQDFVFFGIGQKRGADDLFFAIENLNNITYEGASIVKILMEALLEKEKEAESSEESESDSCSESIRFKTLEEAKDYAQFVGWDTHISKVEVKQKGDAWVVLVHSAD